MKSKYGFLIVGITSACVVIPASSWAATVVERSEMRGTQKIIMEEYRARINSPFPEHYMLMDLEKEKVYLVDTKKKRLVEMDINGTPAEIPQDMRPPSRERRNGMSQDRWQGGQGGPYSDRRQGGWQGGPHPDGRQGGPYPDERQGGWQGGPPQYGRQDGRQGGPSQYGRQGGPQSSDSVKAQLIKQGEARLVAGYPTVKYQVMADDKVCSESYFSQEVFKVPYVEKFLKAFRRMSSSRKPQIKGMRLPPCMKAHDDLEAQLMGLGVPMKTILKIPNQGEVVRDEIISIKTEVEVSPGSFNLPRGYQVMSELEMMEEGRKEMKKRMEEARQRYQQRQGEQPYRR